jgi:hypothetical protein
VSARASAFGLALVLALACEAEQLSIGAGPPLQQGDVEDVPAGSAMGTDATGAYLFTAFSVERCECREGDPVRFGCELVWELQADGLWLDQEAGELSATLIRAGRLDPAFVLRGGIEPDGAFEMGAAFDVVDFDAAVGTGYNLASGVLVPRDSIDTTWIIRAQFVQGSEAFDCDLESDMSLAWWQAEIPAGGGESGDDGGSGDDGLPECDDATPCPDTAPICVQNVCQAGTEGDPCGDPLDCDPAHVCVEGTCFDGTEGDPCTSPVDCAFESRHCIDGACWDGSAGDPCETEVDCDLAAGLQCGPSQTCE